MNNVQIAVILDRSGSMSAVRDATVDNFNEFIEAQRTAVAEAQVQFVQFDDRYDLMYDGELSKLPKLSRETFIPRGSTALHDAIGRTVDQLGKEFASRPEEQRPDKVVVLILTDGHENASTQYSKKQIAEKIKHQQDVYKWQFVFIGATEDAVLTAKEYNIPAGLSVSSSFTDVWKYSNTMRAASSNVATYLRGSDTAVEDFSDELREEVKIENKTKKESK